MNEEIGEIIPMSKMIMHRLGGFVCRWQEDGDPFGNGLLLCTSINKALRIIGPVVIGSSLMVVDNPDENDGYIFTTRDAQQQEGGRNYS